MNKPEKSFDETDAILARKLQSLAPPQDLRRRLIALEPENRWRWSRLFWQLGAAAAAAALTAGLLVLSTPRTPVPTLAQTRSGLAEFVRKGFALEKLTPTLADVRHWLADAQPASPPGLPSGLDGRPPIGCRKMEWRGLHGVLVCFALESGQEAHLFIFPKSAFPEIHSSTPVSTVEQGWTTSAWTDGVNAYVLLAPENSGAIHQLFAVSAVRALREIQAAWTG